MKTTSVQDQLTSAIVEDYNITRIQNKISQLNIQDDCFMKATSEIDAARDFINNPSGILGSDTTKHGEIAEVVEVQVRRAKDYLENKPLSATFEGVGRTAPEDYLINNMPVQSKYINGLNNNLRHVMEHMDKYPSFGRDGSYYHIPKDQYETILKIYNGEPVEGLNPKTIQTIKEKIDEIQSKSGQPFTDVIKPGISKYAEIQQGEVLQTLDKHQQELEQQNEEIKKNIQKQHQASISEGLKAASTAAAVGASLSLATSLYIKYRSGKNVFKGELDTKDWKEIGVKAGKTAIFSGITGGAVYALTNCAGLSAPIAGAFVTATKGVTSLVQDFHQGNISFEEFQVNAIYLCADSAGVGLATIIGQTAIPIPIIGAVLGSLAGKLVCSIILGEDKKLAQEMEKSMQQFIGKIDHQYQDLVNKINLEFDRIKDLRSIAFDIQSNIDLIASSVDLARAHGVQESKILKNKNDLRLFLFD